jgi:DNA-binding protein YbaB
MDVKRRVGDRGAVLKPAWGDSSWVRVPRSAPALGLQARSVSSTPTGRPDWLSTDTVGPDSCIDGRDCVMTNSWPPSEAETGSVRVQLDSAGAVLSVVIEPAAMTLSPSELGEAVAEAFRLAQAALAPTTSAESTQRLEAALADASGQAEQRFAEISTALYGLNSRAEREW